MVLLPDILVELLYAGLIAASAVAFGLLQERVPTDPGDQAMRVTPIIRREGTPGGKQGWFAGLMLTLRWPRPRPRKKALRRLEAPPAPEPRWPDLYQEVEIRLADGRQCVATRLILDNRRVWLLAGQPVLVQGEVVAWRESPDAPWVPCPADQNSLTDPSL